MARNLTMPRSQIPSLATVSLGTGPFTSSMCSSCTVELHLPTPTDHWKIQASWPFEQALGGNLQKLSKTSPFQRWGSWKHRSNMESPLNWSWSLVWRGRTMNHGKRWAQTASALQPASLSMTVREAKRFALFFQQIHLPLGPTANPKPATGGFWSHLNAHPNHRS